MRHRLEHRGPDDFGYLSWSRSDKQVTLSRDVNSVAEKQLAMVHLRLSILDLTNAGWQPMSTLDGRYSIVFNGEIYNFIELRKELEVLGHQFKGHSDTEVLLAAWQEWGVSVLARFIGMFAFVIFDILEQTLTLVRDPFGIKPLYWGAWDDGIVFASEIQALLELPGVDKRVSPQSIYEYLRYGYTDRGADTLLRSIKRVEAASFLKFDLNAMQQVDGGRYWNLEPNTISTSFKNAAEQLRELFLESVNLHLRSDVPVGIALSGGIDSTSILGAAHFLSGGEKIHAFSFISEDSSQSEEKWIDLASSYFGVKTHKIYLRPEEFSKNIVKLIRNQGEPFATTGMLAQSQVFERVRAQGIKVTLDGQGADEILAGYPTYLAAMLADSIGKFQFQASRDYLSAGGFSCFFRAVGMLLPMDVASKLRYLIGEEESPVWLNSKWFNERGVGLRAVLMPRRRDRLHDRLEQTITDLSLPALLRYADRNAMAYSVESRVPFLTVKLADFVLSLPSNFLINQKGVTKAVFREAMRGLVPDLILDRSDKVGFSVPESSWLGHSEVWLRNEISRCINILPMINPIALNEMAKKLNEGKKISDSKLWRCICLAIWAEEFSIDFS